MKIINNFVWLIVTEKAKDIFHSGIFELYILYDDGTESLITRYDEINEALENGLDIAIEVGHLNN